MRAVGIGIVDDDAVFPLHSMHTCTGSPAR
jgi:hypothetical protein